MSIQNKDSTKNTANPNQKIVVRGSLEKFYNDPEAQKQTKELQERYGIGLNNTLNDFVPGQSKSKAANMSSSKQTAEQILLAPPKKTTRVIKATKVIPKNNTSNTNEASSVNEAPNSNITSQSNPEESDTSKKNAIVEKTPLINMSKINKSDNLFIKSYYAHDFLNPYIRCFIQNKIYNENFTDLQKKNFQKNFFDIPYNLIKSMNLEYVGGGGVEGSLQLKIEDPTGSIGTFLIGALFAMSIAGNNAPSPSISIEFGWSPNGLKKISKLNRRRIVTSNVYPLYLVIKAELEFDEKGRQEVVITAKQDGTGAAENFPQKGKKNPLAILGSSPINNIRLIQYYHYFKFNTIDIGLNKFSVFTQEKKQPEKNKIKEIVNKFMNNVNFNSNSNSKFDKISLIQMLAVENQLFNPESSIIRKDFVEMRDKFAPHLEKSYFNSYLVFCYILNQYIITLKQIFKDEGDNVDFLILPLYDEKKIIRTGLDINLNQTIQDFCVKDVELGQSKPKDTTTLTSSSLPIGDSDTWESLLTRVGKLVKLGTTKNSSNLFVSIKRYTKDVNSSIINRSNDSDIIKTSSKDQLINKFKALLDAVKNDDIKKEKIRSFIKQIKETNNDFIYVVITPGSPFLTDETFGDKIIAQSYTVYPKINVTDRLRDQNFNSGSQKISDGSFPDVIYFKPKLNYMEAISSNISTNFDEINYNNGVFTFSLANIEIKSTSDQKIDSANIINLIKILKKSIDEKKNLTITLKEDDFYTIYGENNIKIKHQKLSGSNLTIEGATVLVNDLNEYNDTLRRGYHYSTLLGILKKTNNISIGDNNTANYYNYVNSANEYNKILAQLSKGFEAELKILGEPGFTLDFSGPIHIVLTVNNMDGSVNKLFTGLYFVKKIRHEITEKGDFTTTLSLTYDSPYVND